MGGRARWSSSATTGTSWSGSVIMSSRCSATGRSRSSAAGSMSTCSGPGHGGAAWAAGPAAAPKLAPGSAAERAAKKELQRLERQIDRLSEREEKLHADLAANATDYAKLTELGDQLRALQDEKAALEERWLEVAAELD